MKGNKSNLPCVKTNDCPYEYNKEGDRDIEGMPFIDNDPRSCPKYGHICPVFMEELGFTVQDLNIRAVIHCGSLLDHQVEEGMISSDSDEYKGLKAKYIEITTKYPKDKFPQYYQ